MGQLYIPDHINEGMISFSFEGYLKIVTELYQTRTERDTAQSELTNARDNISALETQLKTVTTEATAAHEAVITLRKELETVTAEATAQQQKAVATINALEREIEVLSQRVPVPTIPTPPPTIPSPLPRVPVISKTEISGVAALTIEKGNTAPGPAQYTEVREVLRKASEMGFNAWRGFLNADEVRKHLSLPATDPNHLPGFGRVLGLQFMADTVDMVIPKLDDAQLRAYLKGLESLGARAVVFNDANQYPLATLETMVQRVRAVLPDMPIIASLTAAANISAYPMFDLYEAQTFGTLAEMKTFLTRPFDVFCLDARKSISAVELTTRAAIILAARPKAFFYYTDLAIDWINMPLDKQGAIRKMIESWKAAR